MTGLFPAPPGAACGPPAWREADGLWLLTRHADVHALLRMADAGVVEFHPRILAIGQRAGRDYRALVGLLAGILFFRNPPWQARARASLRRSLGAIGPRMAEAAIAPVIDGAIAGLGPGTVDAVPCLADRIPVLVMAHLLGLSEATVATLHCDGRGVVNAWQRAMPLRVYDTLQQQAAAIDAALRREIRLARAEGGPLRDFLAAGEDFTDDEQVGLLFGIIMAGIETTAGLLASILHAAAAPGAAAAGERAVVEEVLRLAPPVRRPSARRLPAERRFGEVAIPPGALVGIDIAAAQRDPAAHADPHRFDPGRAGPPLLAFGSGIHACLGGHLATLEARLLLRGARRAGLATPPGGIAEWDPDPTFCRLRRLDLRRVPPHDRTLPAPC